MGGASTDVAGARCVEEADIMRGCKLIGEHWESAHCAYKFKNVTEENLCICCRIDMQVWETWA